MNADENYVVRREVVIRRVRIPNGCVKCPFCGGRGELEVRGTSHSVDSSACPLCRGSGFVLREVAEEWGKKPSMIL
ncbi:MAG: hypothetical protein QXD04_03345 [Candidatus Bathyarchaeia archaeon]